MHTIKAVSPIDRGYVYGHRGGPQGSKDGPKVGRIGGWLSIFFDRE